MSHPFPAQADVKREKVKVLRSVRPLDADHDLVVGQFDGYADDPSVADKATTTETFAAARLFIDNPRWAAVCESNLQLDFNVSVFECFDTITSAVLRELAERNRSIQKSAETTSIRPS